MSDILTLYVDGGCRGNPGPSGGGIVIQNDGATIYEAGIYLGEMTNNAAEYNAMIIGMTEAAAIGSEISVDRLIVKSDSQLMMCQMSGKYRVKNTNLRKLAYGAALLAKHFKSCKFIWIPREQNQRADELANKAMDEHES